MCNGEVGDQVIAATELELIGTGAAGEGVVGIAADQAVGAAVADECVGEGIARGVDVAGAREGELLDVGRGGVGHRGLDQIGAF